MTLVDSAVAERVLARALARGGDLAEVYAEDRRSFSLSLDDGRVERPQAGSERGAGVRVVMGEATYFGHVDGLEEDDLLGVADSVAAAVRSGAREPVALGAPTAAAQHVVAVRPQDVDATRKADLLRECAERAYGAGDHVRQARIAYAESRRLVEVFSSTGVAAADDRTRVRLSAQVVAKRGERVETGSDTLGGHAGFDLVEDGGETGAKAARRALTLLDAVEAPTGRMPVVVGHGFGGVLLHEAVGHGLEADAVHKRASVYAGRLGERLAPEFVTAYDDGLRANEWGSDGIDDEGTPTQRTTVIEDGELTSYLYDVLRARKDGVSSTGNGRRQSFRHLPVPRMTNTYFAPGEAEVADLIEGVERGLYAVSFGGGQVEPATGDFVFGVSEGYLIEGGRVTAPIRTTNLIGSGPDSMTRVTMVGHDLGISEGIGMCGKNGQNVPVSVGMPTILVDGITVGGTRQ